MEPLVILRDIECQRGDFRLAIEQLELAKNRIYLLEGPNGAGKSTLLQLLALLLVPAKGTVCFGGAQIASESRRQHMRRHITMVDQNPYLFDTSVYKNLAFGLRLRNLSGDLLSLRISKALEMVGLPGFDAHRARSLSGGETRRVSLARAMVLQPRLLLLDEPNAGLDREILPVFEKCLATLPGQGTTVVIASHDRDQSRRLAGEVLTLNRGRLLPTSQPFIYTAMETH
ncbi:MAG: energy-coupling factor ABC transporter ATP-binding protein [Desulfuromonadales bacterium]